MDVEVCDDIFADNDATRAWQSLYLASQNPNPFLSLAWARAWVEAYDEVGAVLVFRVTCESGTAILPMMRWQGQIRSLCYNATDYTGSLTTSLEATQGLASALLSYAAEQDVILWNVLESDPIVVALKNLRRVSRVSRTPIHFSDLTMVRPDVSTWIKASSTRKQALRDYRRLVRDGAVVRLGLRSTDVDLNAIMDLHDAEWRSKGEPGKFAEPQRRAFLRGVCGSELDVRFATLTVDGRLGAYKIGLRTPRSFMLWNSGFDMALKSRGPGSALLMALVLHYVEGNEVAIFDFLRGDEMYKRAFLSGSTAVSTYEITRQPS